MVKKFIQTWSYIFSWKKR